MDGTSCPLVNKGLFVPRHVPFLFFDDVTDSRSATSSRCNEHIRPYGELSADLTRGAVARYKFITPDLCDDMHNDRGCASSDSVQNASA